MNTDEILRKTLATLQEIKELKKATTETPVAAKMEIVKCNPLSTRNDFSLRSLNERLLKAQ
ncbi:hypothetical protein [Bacteroides faecis]|jgi:hypothetical protein|uniref:hypothetical protein n=1 Tax=Bacteroides faecis TaxID=674529 RepID=UPI001C8B2FAA|nr:hypothetical protein [Bacteroides faecis]